jgi:ABC-type uncharacterized transport system involved in gliding motility auxiliary subunit
MTRGLISAGGLIVVAIIFIAVNIIGNLGLCAARLDLTADKLFTLSEGTRSVLAKIQEPITLRLYYSDRLGKEIPQYGVYATRVREMLREYANAAPGKVRLEFIDPQPFSDDEDRAVAFGLQGVPVNQAGELVYFGLAGTNSADKEETIAFIQPERERFLEYDLTKLVYNLAITKKPSVGLLSTLPLSGEFRGPRQPPEPWAIYTQMQQFFDVKTLDRDIAEIPAEIGVLVLVHPKELSEKTQYAIDQFVMRGGHVLVFVDPHAEGEMGRPGTAAQTGMTGSNLPKLFSAWGLEMVDGKFAGDRGSARRVNAGTESRVRAVDYIAWLSLREANFNRSDILTSETSVIQMASAGILKPKEGATTTFTPLIQTSEQSAPVDVDSIKMMPDPVSLLANFKPEGQRLTLAARINGPVKTAFPDGPPPEPKTEGDKTDEQKPADAKPAEAKPAEAKPTAPQIKEAREPANIIVVADTDMLEDRFWAQVQDFFGQRVAVPIAGNGDFVINAVDNLLGSNALISLRSRGQSARPFTLVQDLQRDAEVRFRAKEKELTQKMRDTEKKLSDLQSQSQEQGGGRAMVSKAQQETIDQFRSDLLVTRKELRNVQQNLRSDIQTLEAWTKFVNIALVPIIVAIVAVLVGLARNRKRRRAAAASA